MRFEQRVKSEREAKLNEQTKRAGIQAMRKWKREREREGEHMSLNSYSSRLKNTDDNANGDVNGKNSKKV